MPTAEENKPTTDLRVELPTPQHRALKSRAAEAGKTIRTFVREMVERELGAQNRPAPSAPSGVS